jgi:uncharacterized membrane protein
MLPSPENVLIRIASIGHAVFAVIMIVLGVVGFLHPGLVSLWNPVSINLPAHDLLVHLIALISMAAGVGLLVQRMAATAARLLLATLVLWLLLLRLPNFFLEPVFAACWSVFPLLLMVAAAWVLYVWFAAGWECHHLGYILGNNGLRIARSLYGLSLTFFGIAHFVDIKDTLSLIPHWLPFHLFWAYFTGCAFIAAGLATLIGFCARLAVTLSALQLAAFLFLVWIPIVAMGSKNPFQWSETILNAALCAGAWVMTDSYRNTRWLTFNHK